MNIFFRAQGSAAERSLLRDEALESRHDIQVLLTT
jgi:hypothetical protein